MLQVVNAIIFRTNTVAKPGFIFNVCLINSNTKAIKMKKIIIVLLMLFAFATLSQSAFSQKRKSSKAKTVRVKSYTTKKGKHVKSHYRSKPSKKRRTFIITPMLKPKELAA